MAGVTVLPNLGTTLTKTGQCNLGANNDTLQLDVSQYNTVALDIQGTFTATMTWTCSVDGAVYFTLSPYSTLGGISGASTGTANQQLFFNTVGIQVLRLQITAYTSGTINLTWNCDSAEALALLNIGRLTPGTLSTDLGKAEDAAHTSGDTGVAVWGVRNDTQTAFTNADGDYSPIATTPQGYLLTQPGVNVSTSNRPLSFRQIAAGSTNATSVKGTAAQVFAIVVNNTSAAIKYLKIYNKATAPTVGTDTPVLVIGVPPTSTQQVDFAGFSLSLSAGLATATTGLGTDADATAVTASDLSFTVLYF